MDAKSLLRAKKATARIEHPYASYNVSGVLRCSICAVPVKQWDAHLLTKQHRQSVAREKETAAKAKRRADDDLGKKAKRAKIAAAPAEDEEEEPTPGPGPSLPAGFFSAGNQPAINNDDDDEAEAEASPALAPAPPPTGDAELDDFLSSLNDGDGEPAPPLAALKAAEAAKKRRGYKETDEEGVASYSAAPVLNRDQKAEAEAEPEPEETDEERRARLEQEEKEEIMARLDEEERAQEDADSRVSALKDRVAAMKKKRELMKAKAGMAGKAGTKEKK